MEQRNKVDVPSKWSGKSGKSFSRREFVGSE